jgi:hypothetical protein
MVNKNNTPKKEILPLLAFKITSFLFAIVALLSTFFVYLEGIPPLPAP